MANTINRDGTVHGPRCEPMHIAGLTSELTVGHVYASTHFRESLYKLTLRIREKQESLSKLGRFAHKKEYSTSTRRPLVT
jgi:hypothetical protein